MLSWFGQVIRTYRFISCSAFVKVMRTKRAQKSQNDMFQKVATALDSKETPPLWLATNQLDMWLDMQWYLHCQYCWCRAMRHRFLSCPRLKKKLTNLFLARHLQKLSTKRTEHRPGMQGNVALCWSCVPSNYSSSARLACNSSLVRHSPIMPRHTTTQFWAPKAQSCHTSAFLIHGFARFSQVSQGYFSEDLVSVEHLCPNTLYFSLLVGLSLEDLLWKEIEALHNKYPIFRQIYWEKFQCFLVFIRIQKDNHIFMLEFYVKSAVTFEWNGGVGAIQVPWLTVGLVGEPD